MSFFSEAAVKAGLTELSLAGGYNIINYNGSCVYVEGIKHLLRVSEEEISLELRGAKFIIKGKDLRISELSEAAIIKGTIDIMELEHNEKKKK